MQDDQTLNAATKDGEMRNLKVRTICTPSGSMVKPSMTRRAAYERFVDATAREPDERRVKCFEYPLWGGHRLGADRSGLECYREHLDKVSNRDPSCRRSVLQELLQIQFQLSESDCWVDSIHPTRTFAT